MANNSVNQDNSLGNFIVESYKALNDAVYDLTELPYHRRLIHEISLLLDRVESPQKGGLNGADISLQPHRLTANLEIVRERLKKHIDVQASCSSPSSICIQYGKENTTASNVTDNCNGKPVETATSDVPSKSVPQPIDKEKMQVINSLIVINDWIAHSHEENPVSSDRLLEIVERKILELIKELGVEPIENSGLFDSKYQRIVDVLSTNDLTLNETVATNVRTGYLLGEQLIRPQDVIIYKKS